MKNRKYTVIGIVAALWICIVAFIGFRIYKSSQQYSDWIQQAAAYEQDGKYEEALISYAMASSIKPKKAEPYLKMAEIYEDQGDYDNAASILRIGRENIGSSFARKKEAEQIAKKETNFYEEHDSDTIDDTKVPDAYVVDPQDADDDEPMDDIVNDLLKQEQKGNGNTFSAISDGSIYYTGQDGIYTVKTDGTGNQSVKEIDPSDTAISDFQIRNRMAYYLEAKNTSQDGVYDYSLCTMDLETGEEDVLYEMDMMSDVRMKMDEDTIYLASEEGSGTDITAGLTVPEIKIETLTWNEEEEDYDEPIELTTYEGNSADIYVQDKKIYYSKPGDSEEEMMRSEERRVG